MMASQTSAKVFVDSFLGQEPCEFSSRSLIIDGLHFAPEKGSERTYWASPVSSQAFASRPLETMLLFIFVKCPSGL